MCGIIGYIGNRQATPILISGLKRLEYRGYDSAGVGIVPITNNSILVRKTHGKIRNLEELIASQPLPHSTLGISHTRWATHGAPNKINAHPHFGPKERILVVHNGIIENYEELREILKKKGHKFLSETDTEIIAHLIEAHYKDDLLSAVAKAIKQMKGSFAIGVIAVDDPDTLIAARIGSPLIVGIGKGE